MINEAFVEDGEVIKNVDGLSENNRKSKNKEKQPDRVEECELKQIDLTNTIRREDLEVKTKKFEESEDDQNAEERIGWSSLNITVEPIRFLVFFITSFTNGLIIDLMELNVCQYKFNLTFSECQNNLTQEMRTELQSDLATVAMINDLVKGIFPVALVLFLGPWSDRNGRKPWLLWAMRGFICTHFLWLIVSLFSSVPIICFVIPAIPYSMSGGLLTINICTWSYICDIYKCTERPFRFSIFSMVALVGTLCGNLMAAEVFYMAGEYGYQVVFSITTLIACFTLLYTSLFLEETVKTTEGASDRLFDISLLKSVFEVVLIHPKFGLLRNILILGTLTCEISARLGDDHLAYLVGKSEYSWSLRDYNFFASLTCFIQACIPVPFIWLLQEKFKFHNHVVILFAGFLMFASEFARGLATNEMTFWVASCFLVSSALIGPNIDTELSKCVSEDDLGKACALVSLVDAMAPLVTIPLYTRLYQYLLPRGQTLYTYLLSAGLSTVLITVALTLLVTYRLKMKKILIFRENA